VWNVVTHFRSQKELNHEKYHGYHSTLQAELVNRVEIAKPMLIELVAEPSRILTGGNATQNAAVWS
jgi:hypothetical protein